MPIFLHCVFECYVELWFVLEISCSFFFVFCKPLPLGILGETKDFIPSFLYINSFGRKDIYIYIYEAHFKAQYYWILRTWIQLTIICLNLCIIVVALSIGFNTLGSLLGPTYYIFLYILILNNNNNKEWIWPNC